MTQLENRQHSFGISAFLASVDIFLLLMARGLASSRPTELENYHQDGDSLVNEHYRKTSELKKSIVAIATAISEFATRCSAKLGALPLSLDLSYLPVTCILAAVGFVSSTESYKKGKWKMICFCLLLKKNVVNSQPKNDYGKNGTYCPSNYNHSILVLPFVYFDNFRVNTIFMRFPLIRRTFFLYEFISIMRQFPLFITRILCRMIILWIYAFHNYFAVSVWNFFNIPRIHLCDAKETTTNTVILQRTQNCILFHAAIIADEFN